MKIYWIAEDTCTVKLDSFPTAHLLKVEEGFKQLYAENLIASYVTIDAITLTFSRPGHIQDSELLTLVTQHQRNEKGIMSTSGRIIEIPVRYGGKEGPDLSWVASYHGLSEEEIIRRHTEGNYRVTMIGFVPAFPYLDGLHPSLHTPRKEIPTLTLPAGSVGIGGSQTGIYPLASPGGWQIIGRTDLHLFQPEQKTPSLLQAGDYVKFVQVRGIKG